MLYVGLDLHTKQITSCVLNRDGKLHERWQVRQVDQLVERFIRFEEPFQVTYEASCGYGRFFELLSPISEKVRCFSLRGQSSVLFPDGLLPLELDWGHVPQR